MISENAKKVLEQRYLTKDENGNPVESVEGLFHRVAHAIAEADLIHDYSANVDEVEETFFNMMYNLEFLPNSPTLMNAGKELGQLSACFVLPIEDSMESIFETVKQAALIHKSGGGTGFSFSRIRQEGSIVKSTGGVASGPISFLKVFDAATESIKQGGTRRGANMGILRIDHPDILKFIDCKKDNRDINNFNISVGITEEFMLAVQVRGEYDLIDPHTGMAVGRLNAGEVFDKIVDAAWRNGEPGIVFLDRLNRDNIVPGRGEFEATNPCGEQPLLPFESCNLGSINLTKMLVLENGRYVFDVDKIEETVRNAVHFLDNVIDVNRYPLPQIDKTTKDTRKIGLGVMGWADALLMMGLPYNSDEAVILGERIMQMITAVGRKESERLASERGTFPLFRESTFADGKPLRNGTITTIAPTGTLSIIAGCSSGIEPVFAYVFVRNVMDGMEMLEVNPVLEAELEKAGILSEELLQQIAANGSLHGIEEIPEEIRNVFVSTHEISPEYHVKMQAAFQRHTDNAVSKTVNFSNDATRDDVAMVYNLAFETGCKGVTIYRDGSRSEQVLNIGEVKHDDSPFDDENVMKVETRIIPRERPDYVSGVTEKIKIGCGNLYITVNYDDIGICEIFTNTGKAGGCPSQSEATARLASIAFRSGIDVKTIVDQLKGIRCPSTIRQQGMKCTSCPDAMARVIEQEYEKQVQLGNWKPMDEQAYEQKESVMDVVAHETFGAEAPKEKAEPENMVCPECGGVLEHESGCVICRQCAYSKCG